MNRKFERIEKFKDSPEWERTTAQLSTLLEFVGRENFFYAFAELFAEQFVGAFSNRDVEFPKSEYDELHKFRNHDAVLGWEPQPGGPYFDGGHSKKTKKVGKQAVFFPSMKTVLELILNMKSVLKRCALSFLVIQHVFAEMLMTTKPFHSIWKWNTGLGHVATLALVIMVRIKRIFVPCEG